MGLLPSIDCARLDGRPIAELKLDTDPVRFSFAVDFLTLAGVEKPPCITSMGGDAVDAVPFVEGASGRIKEVALSWEEMVVLARLSAKSEAESSWDRVRPIFLEGV